MHSQFSAMYKRSAFLHWLIFFSFLKFCYLLILWSLPGTPERAWISWNSLKLRITLETLCKYLHQVHLGHLCWWFVGLNSAEYQQVKDDTINIVATIILIWHQQPVPGSWDWWRRNGIWGRHICSLTIILFGGILRSIWILIAWLYFSHLYF
jgi:hypothetical protein